MDHTLQKLIENINDYGTLLEFLFERYPTALADYKNKKTFETGNGSKATDSDGGGVTNYQVKIIGNEEY